MHAAFWQERWARSEIGFHQAEVNGYLQQYWPKLEVPPAAQILLPLCGKSLDLLWLAQQGYRVLGVEWSHKAVEDFFAEQGFTPQISSEASFLRYRYDSIEILCGDFFALTAEQVSQCQAVYDRAALIALPEAMRERYVSHLTEIVPAGCVGLLVSLDYEQTQMSGPPFAVADEWVRCFYATHWQVSLLLQQDVLPQAENARFLRRGLSRLHEWVYRLQKL